MKTLRVLLLVLVSFASLRGGSPDPAPGLADGLTVRLMSWSGELSELLIADGASYVTARAGEFLLGRPIRLSRRAATMRFFREEPWEEGTRKAPLAEVALPGETRDVLVVLAPAGAGEALPLQGRALDQSLKAHPLDTARVVNFSGHTLALRVGGETAVLGPGEDRVFPFPASGADQLSVDLAAGDGAGGWRWVQSSLQPAPRGRRVLGIVRDGRPDPTIEDPALRTKVVDAIFLVDRAAPRPAVAGPSLAKK